MIRLDSHVTVGSSPPGKQVRSNPAGTIDGLLEHFKVNEITHACVYYLPTNEHLLLDLISNSRETKVFPVRWIDSYTEDVSDFDVGVKLNAMRGSRIDPNSIKAKRFIKKLPAGFKIFVHMQSSSTLKNVSRPQTVLNLAFRNPDKIFIICHSGAYGWRTFLPKDTSNMKVYNDCLIAHYSAQLLVREAVFVASLLDNVYLETSFVLRGVRYKSQLLSMMKDKVLFGSDHPFLSPYVQSLKRQEKEFMELGWTEEDIKEVYERGVKLMERGEK